MATSLKTVDSPPASMAPLRVLTGLYRSTFVDNMQERFRSMLTGAYAVYVTALGEDFDPPLRAHLIDILQEIISRESEFTEIFKEELLRHFRLPPEQSEPPDASASQINEQEQSLQPKVWPEADEDPEVREFIAKTIRSIETRHGSIILAVTRTYVKLVNQPIEDFRPPWSPAYLFSAFAAILNRIEVPIHGRVKLALYQTFAQEVLRHIGDACLAFRDVLPNDLSQLNALVGEETSAPPNGSRSSGPTPDTTPSTSTPIFADKENGSETISGLSDHPNNRDGNLTDKDSRADTPRTRTTMKLLRLTMVLLGGLGLIWGGWWLGAYIARTKSMPVLNQDKPTKAQNLTIEPPSMEARPEQPTAEPPPPAQASTLQTVPEPPPSTPTTAHASPEQPAPLPLAPESTTSPIDRAEKREIMRAVKLKNFNWKVDANSVLFKLIIANASKHPIGGIEIVCSQYSKNMDFLEAAKTVLEEPIKPGQTKEFQAIPIGFANKRTERVNCVIADLAVVPDQ
jgi:hypothetical protein